MTHARGKIISKLDIAKTGLDGIIQTNGLSLLSIFL
jgi:hypothetical protein